MDLERDRRSGRDSGLRSRRAGRLRLPRSLRATRAGGCFVIIIFGVGFAALNTGNNLLYLVLALLLGFLVLSGLLSEASLRGLRIERRLPAELFANTSNRIGLRIRNQQSRTPSFAILIEDRWEGPESIEAAGRVFVLRLGPNHSVERSYLFEPPRRGDMRFVGCRVSTRFPFGLFIKCVDLDLESSAVIYPELQQPRGLESSNRSNESDLHNASSSVGGALLSGVREYIEGDSLRRIHWRRSLRAKKLIVGERQADSGAEVEVELVLPHEMGALEGEYRVSKAASEVHEYLRRGLQVGLRTDKMRFTADSGPTHRQELMTFLARFDLDLDDRRDDPRVPAT